MCEANAYMMKDGSEHELLMEAVDSVEPEDGGFRLVNIFGEQKFVRGVIHSMSLVDHKVIFRQETAS